MTKTARLLVATACIVVFVGAIAYVNRVAILDLWKEWTVEASLPEPVNAPSVVLPKSDNMNVQPVFKMPDEYNLAVPFTPQAPFAVWDETHNEACEEAASLMVHYFWQGKTFTPQIAEDEIQQLVNYETITFGFFQDTTGEQTAQFIRDYLGYKDVRVQYDITIDDIKNEVAHGRPVIVLAAGRLLGNLNFRSPGPLYHALVIRGYTADGRIITNDPGTRKGEEFVYEPDVLMNAIHDWNRGDVNNGRKVMIVVYPNEG